MPDRWDDPFQELTETDYAQGRVPGRTYLSRSFAINRESSQDFGLPARFVYKVIDTAEERTLELDGDSWLVRSSPGGRYQVRVLVSREAGRIKDLWIQRVPSPSESGTTTTLLHLEPPEVDTLADFFRALSQIPVTGDSSVRVDDSVLRDVLTNAHSISALYQKDPATFRDLIRNDESIGEVVALGHRKKQVELFRRLIEDDDFFDQQAAVVARAEDVWQRFFEANPWILGVTLTGQLLTAWDDRRLEQVVAGASAFTVGKRADALLRTAGRVRSLVFAEFKTHRTSLLDRDDYRSGCWSPSREVAGGVAQVQGTVHRVVSSVGERVAALAEDGSEVPDDFGYLIRPRSFLVVGSLASLVGQQGGLHGDRVRSFELYRRLVVEPEILTFDELLARAEWFVSGSAQG